MLGTPPCPMPRQAGSVGNRGGPRGTRPPGWDEQSKSNARASEIWDFLSSINSSWQVSGCFPCPWSSPECPVLPPEWLGAAAQVWTQHSLHPRPSPSLSLQTCLTSAKISSTKPSFEVRPRTASRHWWQDIGHQVLLQLPKNRIRMLVFYQMRKALYT